MISFTVDGIPAAKGSKNPWGGEANPNVKPWQAAISSAAREAMNGTDPFAGPVRLYADFYFPRPKAHYRTGKNAATLRDSAPWWVSKKPDLDKLLRALGDALTGIVFRDDSQIAQVEASKQFGVPMVVVQIWPEIGDTALQGERAAETAA